MFSQQFTERIRAAMHAMDGGPYRGSILEAVQFVEIGAVEERVDRYRITSGNTVYDVSDLDGCTCPAAIRGYRKHCKHAAAVELYNRIYHPEYFNGRTTRQEGQDTMEENEVTTGKVSDWMKDLGTIYAKAVDNMPEHTERINAALTRVGKEAPLLTIHSEKNGQWSLVVTATGEDYAVLKTREEDAKLFCQCHLPEGTPGQTHALPQGWCEHRYAMQFLHSIRTAGHDIPVVASSAPDAANNDDADEEDILAKLQIPKRYVTNIQGKQHVGYAGLMWAARRRFVPHGFTLSERWVFNDQGLSLAEAELRIISAQSAADEIWIGSGDASPGNVSDRVKPHFRRMALTRAKSRALRDALGIEDAAAEEVMGG